MNMLRGKVVLEQLACQEGYALAKSDAVIRAITFLP
jgi:hypothetical protein